MTFVSLHLPVSTWPPQLPSCHACTEVPHLPDVPLVRCYISWLCRPGAVIVCRAYNRSWRTCSRGLTSLRTRQRKSQLCGSAARTSKGMLVPTQCTRLSALPRAASEICLGLAVNKLTCFAINCVDAGTATRASCKLLRSALPSCMQLLVCSVSSMSKPHHSNGKYCSRKHCTFSQFQS